MFNKYIGLFMVRCLHTLHHIVYLSFSHSDSREAFEKRRDALNTMWRFIQLTGGIGLNYSLCELFAHDLFLAFNTMLSVFSVSHRSC